MWIVCLLMDKINPIFGKVTEEEWLVNGAWRCEYPGKGEPGLGGSRG